MTIAGIPTAKRVLHKMCSNVWHLSVTRYRPTTIAVLSGGGLYKTTEQFNTPPLLCKQYKVHAKRSEVRTRLHERLQDHLATSIHAFLSSTVSRRLSRV